MEDCQGRRAGLCSAKQSGAMRTDKGWSVPAPVKKEPLTKETVDHLLGRKLIEAERKARLR